MEMSRRTWLTTLAGAATMTTTTRTQQQSLQALHDHALETDGRLYLEPGTYEISEPFRWHPSVTIQGAGMDRTIIRPIAPMATVVECHNAEIVVTAGGISDLTIYGAGVGVGTGLSLCKVARIGLSRVRVSECHTALHMAGVVNVIGERLALQSSTLGAWLTSASGHADDTAEQTSYCGFRDCCFVSNTAVALLADCAAGTVIERCELHGNGTAGVDSGGISIADACRYGEGTAVAIRDCWLEANNGGAAIRFYPPKSHAALHIVENCHVFGGDRRWGLRVEGTGSVPTRYSVAGSSFQNAAEFDLSEGGSNVVRAIGADVLAGRTAFA
jgi:hypothetical protein